MSSGFLVFVCVSYTDSEMPLPLIADTIRTSIELLTVNGHKAAFVLHFRKTGALSYTGAIALLDPILADFLTNNHGGGASWKNHAPTGASIQRLDYTPLDGTSATTRNTHVIAGADGGDPLPASVALVVTLRTALRGRSHQGRVYTGPYTEAGNTAGAPTALLVGDVAAQWSWLVATGLPGSGLTLVVASYKLSTATDVVTTTVDSRWDTQRRRLNT